MAEQSEVCPRGTRTYQEDRGNRLLDAKRESLTDSSAYEGPPKERIPQEVVPHRRLKG